MITELTQLKKLLIILAVGTFFAYLTVCEMEEKAKKKEEEEVTDEA